MKKVHLLSTAAAALLLTVGTASAQTNIKKDEAPEHAPAAQQRAPAEKMAPAQKIAPNLHSGRKAPETTGQAPPKETGKSELKSKEPEKSEMHKPMGKDTHMDKAAQPHVQGDVKTKSKSSSSKNEGSATTKSSESTTEQHRATTGQGAAAGAAKLSSEQRTRITTVLKRHHVAPAHLSVSIHVGTRVPASVHFYPLPVEVVDIYPEWRGYYYILVGDEILVIEPRTHEIVAILEA